MKLIGEFVKSTVVGGLLIILPIGLLAMIVAKFLTIIVPMSSLVIARLPEGFHYPIAIGLILFLLICFVAGLLAQTAIGNSLGAFVEGSVLDRIPGYSLLRSLTRRVGNTEESSRFASAFVEIAACLVPAVVIEEHKDGRFTVFVPSAPTPAVGSIYVVEAALVHLVDAPFIDTVKCVSKFGAGAEKLLRSTHIS